MHLLQVARCCTSVFDFHCKHHQITSKLLIQCNRYHKLRKTFGKFLGPYSEFFPNFDTISFQEYASKGITHLVFCGDLIYKLRTWRRVKCKANIISSGPKMLNGFDVESITQWTSRLERTIDHVPGPSDKAVGTILIKMSKLRLRKIE